MTSANNSGNAGANAHFGTHSRKKYQPCAERHACPTGRLHIGHYFGALQNWVQLQNDARYDCFFFVADWHALTSGYADTSQVAQNCLEIATDYLASGLDPAKSTIFLQSLVPEHAELNLLLSMVTPLGWLERVPTYKEALDNVRDKDLHTYGFLGYPVLQSADIVLYDADLVPVGEDQVAHVELTREIVRRFDFFYGFKIKPELFVAANLQFLSRFAHDSKFLPPNGSQFTAEQKRSGFAGPCMRTKALEQGVEKLPGFDPKTMGTSSAARQFCASPTPC